MVYISLIFALYYRAYTQIHKELLRKRGKCGYFDIINDFFWKGIIQFINFVG